MPFILIAHVREARGLPVMDRATLLTDAYVEVSFGKAVQRTEVCRKTLTPFWDERLRFEFTDNNLLLLGTVVAAVVGDRATVQLKHA